MTNEEVAHSSPRLTKTETTSQGFTELSWPHQARNNRTRRVEALLTVEKETEMIMLCRNS